MRSTRVVVRKGHAFVGIAHCHSVGMVESVCDALRRVKQEDFRRSCSNMFMAWLFEVLA